MKKNTLKVEWRLVAVALLILIAGIMGRNWLACFGAVVLLFYVVVPAIQGRTTTDKNSKAPADTKKRHRKKKTRRREAVDEAPKDTKGLVQKLNGTGRYAVLLRPEVINNLGPDQLNDVLDIVDREMSFVPAGQVSVDHNRYGHCLENGGHAEIQTTDDFLIDRFAVTNSDFKRFIDDGGYETHDLWCEEILPALSEFVDRTGKPGPRGWSNASYPSDIAEHPVVGISWYEANAYARWVGKRLPTRGEWVKTASWPVVTDGQPTRQRKYPWGNLFDESNANVWVTGLSQIVPVEEFENGNSQSDVCQLSGNVWEWMADEFQLQFDGRLVSPEDPMKALSGGAYDTYVERQASCQFASGESPFARKHNVGFRCVLSVAQLAPNVFDRVKSEAVAV